MTKIDSTRWSELSPLLDTVLELSGAERDAWLAQLRATQPEVAERLETLLAQLRSLDDEGFLQGDASDVLNRPVPRPRPS